MYSNIYQQHIPASSFMQIETSTPEEMASAKHPFKAWTLTLN